MRRIHVLVMMIAILAGGSAWARVKTKSSAAGARVGTILAEDAITIASLPEAKLARPCRLTPDGGT